ncbi:23S rRNA (pseudouridine1915-N3)-methyltransferase [Desulfohalotomaculum tongense]|uniref:23S rRNA (pseudouridine(1915)-N(3))-methyltransferase RlmH n=1 Tax=Desulforadius tongensis TaxID=1216062 RepID=UPI00195E4EF7|nr:23S rRNA (pseudouridine(1915)-N(3))-methyltransferase RlmH [Desulforadius tongensis]MBM7853789.1 23S rRNA (pseudouridine1915-N3)-methyltransferase [Desulforadius tongensis]
MRITIISVGKLKEKYLKQGVQEYLKRLQPYAKIEIIEVADEPHQDGISEQAAEQVRQKEAERVSRHIKSSTFLIALDAAGKMYSSEELAGYFEKLMLKGKSDITMLIGGSLGLSAGLLKRCQLRLSFSKLTFPHQLMRLILLEQIYRIFKINRGEPYHK